MANTKNKIGNAVSFSISLALHLGAIYLAYALADTQDETLLAEKDEAPKMLTISLNQISPTINNQNSMQATQELATQPVVTPEPEPVPELILEPVKEESRPEPIKPEKPKIEKPKPKKVAQERPKPKPVQEKPKEPQEQPKKPQPAPTPVALPSSQSVANNEAVSQGGAPQSGKSKSDERAQARTILGEIHAAILKHKTYPKRAINSKMEGRVQVGFLLTGQCEFEKLEVLKSSEHGFLDKHALSIVKKACKDFPQKAVGMNLKVIIFFNLKEVE